MKQRQTSHTQEIDKSGIEKLTCHTCQTACVGQTRRSVKQRYQEHIRYIKYHHPQSVYAQHILNNRHEFGPINETMSLLKQVNNNSLLLPYEQPYIQTHRLHNQLIPEQNTGEHNPIYQLFSDTPYTSLPLTQTDQYH